MTRAVTIGACVLVAIAALVLRLNAQQPRWFSAWAAAHNVGLVVPELAGRTVRMAVRPTISGEALRVKVTNITGNTPAVFSAAFVGVAGPGASVVAGTTRRLTFDGAAGLTLAPDGSAWSDPMTFDVRAFERLAVTLESPLQHDPSAGK